MWKLEEGCLFVIIKGFQLQGEEKVIFDAFINGMIQSWNSYSFVSPLC